MNGEKPTVKIGRLRIERRELGLASLLSLVMALGIVWRDGAVYTAALVIVTVLAFWPTALEAVAGLRERRFNIELFNVLAIIASLALQEWFSAAFIALMLTAARILGEITESRSKRALQELMSLRPKRVFIERDGAGMEIVPSELRPTDTVVIREGETIPVDGDVIGGEAVVNEAPVTGESKPALKVRGDRVLSPSLVTSGVLRVSANRIGSDTTLERIIKLVAAAQAAKSPTLRLADRFVGYFLPGVVMTSLVAYWVTGTADAAIAVLVVACADDIAVSIPLAFLASVGSAARRGIIVNGGVALESLGKATTIFFDKTGTLTYGRPKVESTSLASGVTDEEFWTTVGSVEKYSKHPLAKALRDEVAARNIVPADPDRFETVSGKGVVVQVGDAECLAGSRAFLAERGVSGLTGPAVDGPWHFACAGRFLGTVTVSDVPRSEAHEALEQLRRLGIRRTVMLTGDAGEQAQAVASALGIDEVRSRLLPDQKLEAIREAQAAGEVVIMVGDGINDAPALAAADVGMALGQAGTAVAVETAPVVIMGDDLRLIAEAVGLSRGTRRIVAGDFIIWAITNFLGIGLVFLGIMGPAAAAAYNFATDFLPLINSSRLFGWRVNGKGRRTRLVGRAAGR